LYINGEGVKQDYQKAIQLFEKACNGGVMIGCSNLGVGYENGVGVNKDYTKAAELYKKACEGGESYRGVTILEYCIRMEKVYPADKTNLAKKYFAMACDMKIKRWMRTLQKNRRNSENKIVQ